MGRLTGARGGGMCVDLYRRGARVMFRYVGAAQNGGSIAPRGSAGSCPGQRRPAYVLPIYRRGRDVIDLSAQRRPVMFRYHRRTADWDDGSISPAHRGPGGCTGIATRAGPVAAASQNSLLSYRPGLAGLHGPHRGDGS